MALPAEVGFLADTYYEMTTEHAVVSAAQAQALWQSIPPDQSIVDGWQEISPAMLDLVTQEQVEAALLASAYLEAQSAAQGITLESLPDPTEFVTPTDTSAYWLSYSVTRTLTASNTLDLPENVARAAGLDIVMRSVASLVHDSGREAAQAGMTMSTDFDGYYRKLRLPSCSRCAVLAGAYYRWNDGFLRHPRCDCQHVPAADIDDALEFDSRAAIENGDITGLSQSDVDAINDGADVNQVINAKRGLRTVDIFGDRVQTTTESTTRRGRFYNPGKVRLTPREIYRQAGTDRDLARRLLSTHGYVF